LLGAAVGSLFVTRVVLPARARGDLVTCSSNLKNISTSLEMFSTDHQGHYPLRLGMLVPRYLPELPDCPACGAETYSASYTRGKEPDAYTIFCL
ncbi:unnamed protein product, partial [Phaeothamnion confervicola]